ncbi:MAG: DUF2586 family protein [Polyangiaceae bacterium]
MAQPSQSLKIHADGLNVSGPADTLPLFLGVASKGSPNAIGTFTSTRQIRDGLGHGPLVEDACAYVDVVGGTLLCARFDHSVAGTNSAVQTNGAGPAVTVAGEPNDSYEGKVRIGVGGALGTATFQYSLDGRDHFSRLLTLPLSGTFAVPGTNLTLTFSAGTYVAGDEYTWSSTAGTYSALDLANLVTALRVTSYRPSFTVVSGKHTAAASATLFAALDGHFESLANDFRFGQAILDAGSADNDNDVKAAYASLFSNWLSPTYGEVLMATSNPFVGWLEPTRTIVAALAIAAGLRTISGSPGRVKSGSLPARFRSPTHDERFKATLFNERITTLKTYAEKPGGLYVTQGQLRCPDGSNFSKWQLRRLMNVACGIVTTEQAEMINAGFRTNPNGTIDERDAARWETVVLDALKERLLTPKNDEGQPGHVSAVAYRIDRTNNLNDTETIRSVVAIRPLGYATWIETEIGFALNTEAAA